MKIYIPSRSRSDVILRGTLKWIPKELESSVVFVVPEAQVASYQRSLSWRSSPATVVGGAWDNIAAKRLWIAQQCEDEFICMMDDDLQFLTRTSDSENKCRMQKPEDFMLMWDWVKQSLSAGYSHVGLSPREMNHDIKENGQPKTAGPDVLFKENYRILRAHFFNRADYLSVEHGRVPVMEDFDVTLQLLRRGHTNIVNFYWAQGQWGTNNSGGCSEYRTLEMHNAAAQKLAELHPGIVALKEKETKGGGDLAKRTDVTIQWKKAFGKDL